MDREIRSFQWVPRTEEGTSHSLAAGLNQMSALGNTAEHVT